ncbi:MAG: hypothetical protein QOJ42_5631 [Acidobacteriaceae bacterium]|nr:hypothetical protein [Acidobacteriaceae bacterium]
MLGLPLNRLRVRLHDPNGLCSALQTADLGIAIGEPNGGFVL